MNFKRILTLTGVLVMLACLITGCSKVPAATEADKPSQGTVEDTEEKEKGEKDNSAQSDDKEGWTTLDGATEETVNMDDYVLTAYNKEQVVLLNEDGSVRKTLELTGDLEADSDKGDYVSCVSGNKIIYIRESDSNEEGKQNLYMYDIDADKMTFVDSISSYSHIDCINGDIYVEDSNYDSASGTTAYSTYKYTVGDDGKVECEEAFRQLNHLRQERGLITQDSYYGDVLSFSTAYCINRYGFALYGHDNKIYIYNEDGIECSSIDTPEGHHPLVKAFDGDMIVYEDNDADFNFCGIYLFDLNTLNTTKAEYNEYMFSSENQPTVIGFGDGVIYLCARNIYSGPASVPVLAYDIKKKKTYEVAYESTAPGHTYLSSPIVYNFKVIGNKAYYLAESDTATEWYCLTKDGNKWEKKALNIVAHEYSYSKYAEIKEIHHEGYCPYCGVLCYSDYYEWPVLNSSVENASKINAVFEKMMREHEKSSNHYVPSFTEEDCRDYLHKDGVAGYDGDDVRIYEIREVLDHYLFFDIKGYQNILGAAHGMPYENNKIFDLDTGNEVKSLDEIFDISEEDLKELVAKSAQKDFEEAYDGKYFAQMPEEVYQQAYDETSFDFIDITYYEDYLTFDFPPYDLGPYSSGFISIRVDYKDLQKK